MKFQLSSNEDLSPDEVLWSNVGMSQLLPNWLVILFPILFMMILMSYALRRRPRCPGRGIPFGRRKADRIQMRKSLGTDFRAVGRQNVGTRGDGQLSLT
jgi:hypothetical protein